MAALRIWWLPVLMGVGQLLMSPIGVSLAGRPPSALDSAVAVVTTVVVTVALGWRRRAPEAAFAVILPTLVAGTIALPPDTLSVIALGDLVVLFSLAALRPARVVAVALGLLLATWTVVLLAVDTPESQFVIPAAAIIYVLVAALGRRRGRWQRARANAAARLLAAQDEERRAADVERDRLARDLHDVTAHHLTAVVVHAGAARRLGADRPELIGETLTFAADTGRSTLTALDRLVAVIEPAVEPLPARLARVRAAAPEVTVEVTGALEELPPAVADTVLAVVQEGVTNAMRYAAGVPVAAAVEVVAAEVRVSVHNGPAASSDGAALAVGSGRGLAGLAARTRDLNGTFEAGPCPIGGWLVRALLPRPEPAGAPARDLQLVTSERILDGALTAVALLPPVLTLIAVVEHDEVRDLRLGVLLALLALLHGAPVWWRRVAPWTALAAVLGAALVHAGIVAAARLPEAAAWPLFAGLLAELITVWAVATYARPAVVSWTAALATGGVWGLVVRLLGEGDQVARGALPIGRFALDVYTGALVYTVALLLLGWALAAVLRRRRERLLAAEAAALRAAAARAVTAAQAQRARFAAGLHASVLEPAQRLILAAEEGAGAVPGTGLAALDRVAAEARAGLAAMRELLGVLQPATPGDLAPPPRGTADLAELCADRRSTSLDAPPAPAALPVAVDLSVYRIVEVALDAQRAGAVSVSLVYPADAVTITVAGVPDAATGIAAARIRARVAALGGRVTLDPAGLVRARLPLTPDPPLPGPRPAGDDRPRAEVRAAGPVRSYG